MTWSRLIPANEWDTYEKVLDEAQQRGIPFALGGAFAVAAYTGSWRNTKDLDLYVLPEGRDRMTDLLTSLGFLDYYANQAYDRWWIYRATKSGMIVDIIWATANHRAEVDECWMCGPLVDVRGRMLRILPVEALVRDKLYILQRDRCDWPDVLNLIYSAGREMDWGLLVDQMGEDAPLLAGVLSVFQWVSTEQARALPSWIWEKLRISAPPPEPDTEVLRRRADLLDRRPWFGPDRQKSKLAA